MKTTLLYATALAAVAAAIMFLFEEPENRNAERCPVCGAVLIGVSRDVQMIPNAVYSIILDPNRERRIFNLRDTTLVMSAVAYTPADTERYALAQSSRSVLMKNAIHAMHEPLPR